MHKMQLRSSVHLCTRPHMSIMQLTCNDYSQIAHSMNKASQVLHISE